MKEYKVTVNFGGFVGCELEYVVEADNEDDARIEAYHMAEDDLCIMEIKEV